MKLGVVSYTTLNVGDEIQSLAVKRLLPHVDFEVDREKLHEWKSPDGEKAKFVLNGWYMEKPDHWPPSEDIKPLFISFHISHEFGAAEKMTTPEMIEYYKKHEPIGCRDMHTTNLLKSKGVDAYFSGCATLTFENKFSERNEEIIMADPLFNLWPYSYGKYCAEKLVPEDQKKNIRWITHRRPSRNRSHEERVKDAEKIIEAYSKAKLVFTSRIHVALPCLALGTPVIFINAGYNSKNLSNRFEGLVGNMRTLSDDDFTYSRKNLVNLFARTIGLHKLSDKPKVLDIDWNNPPDNPIDISPIADGIRTKVKNFVKG
ncbi:MAG: polysaccharide pyruvyl transferase family protein [Crocinitomicaceae bacterium]|nr:polysaccharide pyruvyl transferase family protein [Crocinitomicaceae bacterium]